MHQNHTDSDGAGVGSYSVRISEGVDDHGMNLKMHLKFSRGVLQENWKAYGIKMFSSLL
jgi:hypothetical protein